MFAVGALSNERPYREQVAGTTRFTGIEAEGISARIARLLFPEARIRQEHFTRAALPAGFELAIGNPPYVATKFM